MLLNFRFSVSLLLSALLLPVVGQAANLRVNCGGSSEDALPTINSAIRLLNPGALNIVTVSGSCHENILVQGFDRLTLITTTGATINDASGGIVVEIEDSRRVNLEGFTIRGGARGVNCSIASVCSLTGNTVEGGQQGVTAYAGSKVFLYGNTIQNNRGQGLVVAHDSRVGSEYDTFKGNADVGVLALSGASFITIGSVIQNNGNDGVLVTDHSTAELISVTISGNAGNGVTLENAGEARFDSDAGPVTVTANGGSGVLVRDLSFGFFSAGASITGNLAGTDVVCAPQFSATRGALTNIAGGKTNCVEP
jgi:Right handed beta helix region